MAFITLLIYLVLFFIRPADWYAPVLNWPLELVVMSFGLLAGVVSRMTTPAQERQPWPPIFKWLMLWVVVIIISDLVNSKPDAALEHGVRYAKCVAMAAVFWMGTTSVGRVRALMFVYVLLGAVLAIQGIHQIQNNGIGWAGQPLYWGGRIRWIGLWDGANVLSLLFVTTVPLVLEMIFGPWNMLWKVFAVGSGALLLEGLVLGNSRGAWLGLVIILLVFFKKRIGNKGVIVGITAIFLLTLVAPSRIQQGDARDEKSSRGRIEMWAEGLEMVRYYPAFGVGKGQFVAYTHKLMAHNTFVQNMGETGLIGLFVFTMLIYISFAQLGAVFRSADQIDSTIVSVARAVNVGLIGYIAVGMFITADMELLYVFMAMSAVVLTVARKQSGLELPLTVAMPEYRRVAQIAAGIVAFTYVAVNAYKLGG